MHVSRSIRHEQNVLVIQPYVKWGPKKSVVTPDIQMKEAEALIKSLDTWSIQHSMKVGLLNYDKSSFFGKGKIAELKEMLHQFMMKDKKVLPFGMLRLIHQGLFSTRFSVAGHLRLRQSKCADIPTEKSARRSIECAGYGPILGGDTNSARACDQP